MAENKKIKISESLGELESLVNWFEERKDIDVEDGLNKVRKGAAIIKALKTQLKKVEADFKEIKQDLEE